MKFKQFLKKTSEKLEEKLGKLELALNKKGIYSFRDVWTKVWYRHEVANALKNYCIATYNLCIFKGLKQGDESKFNEILKSFNELYKYKPVPDDEFWLENTEAIKNKIDSIKEEYGFPVRKK